MKQVVRLTESDLNRIVRRVINEGMEEEDPLEGHISVYNEYKDGKISKDLFYRFIGVLDRRDKERLLDYIRSEKEESESLNEDEVETNDTFDFSQIHNKLLSDLFTVKHGFNYVKNIDGMEIYSLPRRGFKVMVATKSDNDPSKVSLAIFLKFPMGKSINYLEEVKGTNSMELSINDYNGITRLIQGALDFGKAQDEYDTLPPLK
jgi:hypothetical protein